MTRIALRWKRLSETHRKGVITHIGQDKMSMTEVWERLLKVSHSRYFTTAKSDSTPLCEMRGPAAYGSGESLPGAEVLQAARAASN